LLHFDRHPGFGDQLLRGLVQTKGRSGSRGR
jgi:hypothetical protein